MRTAVLLLFFATVGAAQEAVPAPKIEGVLCQGWDANVTAEGVTDSFFTDNASIRVVYWSDTKPPAGHRFVPVVRALDGTVVQRGRPLETNGASDRWGSGFLLAGQPWARNGGAFTFEIYWDDLPEPILEKPFTVRAAQRFALLVGIADYPPAGPGGSDLPAPDQDAARMADLLVGSFGFVREQITIVTNLDATSARIAAELEALAKKAGPDDAVFFYYAGHGTQIPDLNGDEEDGWDEALATADVRPPIVTTEDQLRLFLSDDRIAELLAKFRTKNVTVVFDSCHSGTAVREGEEEYAGEGFFVPMRERPGFGRKLIQMAEDAPRGAPSGVADGLDVDRGYVFISAAQSWETSMGGPTGGLFSAQFREFLRTSSGESWDQLVSRLRPAVQLRNPGQSAQVMGAGRRFPFTLAEADADAPFVRPSVAVMGAFDPADGLLLRHGEAGKHRVFVSGMLSLMSEQAGIAYDVFPGRDPDFTGEPKGRVIVTGRMASQEQPGGSPLTWAEGDLVSGTVDRGDRLVARAVRIPSPRPNVGIFLAKDLGVDAAVLKATASAVTGFLTRDSGLFVKGGRPSDMDYVILPRKEGDQVVALVLTPAMLFVGQCAGTNDDIAREVRDLVVSRHGRFTRIIRISNPCPPLGLSVSVAGGEGRHRGGETLAFTGTVDRPAFLFAFAAEEGGEARLVASTKEAVAPDQPFTFRVPTSAGTAQLAVKVFATEKPIDLDAIDAAAEAARGDALVEALRKAFPPPDGEAVAIGTNGWAEVVLRVDLE